MIRRPPRSTLFPTRRSSDLTPAGWLIKGPEPDLPDLSVDVQIEALRTAAHSQNETAEVRKQAEAMAERLSALTRPQDRKSTRLNSSHTVISYAVFCLKKKKK